MSVAVKRPRRQEAPHNQRLPRSVSLLAHVMVWLCLPSEWAGDNFASALSYFNHFCTFPPMRSDELYPDMGSEFLPHTLPSAAVVLWGEECVRQAIALAAELQYTEDDVVDWREVREVLSDFLVPTVTRACAVHLCAFVVSRVPYQGDAE